MDLVQLNIAAIRQSDSQNNVYVLLLNETVGKRQLPIVIGWCEARSIAIALDGTEDPGRPLTHDLFKNFANIFEVSIKKVIIHKLIDGVFFSNIICVKNNVEKILDSRTSDTILIV